MKHCVLNDQLVHKDDAFKDNASTAPPILDIILYQLTKFEAHSYNNFRDIRSTSFQWAN